MAIGIGIFATSLPLFFEQKKSSFDYLRSKGFKIIEASNLRKTTGHTAGSIKERLEGLYELLENPEVDILMAYWGGSNTNQLLPFLDYSKFSKYKKPVIGFSDTSAILIAINKFTGIKTFMGPAGITFDKPEPFEYSFEYFKKLVVDNEKECLIEDSVQFADDEYYLREDSNHRIKQKNEGRKVFRQGVAEGEIIASNLQTLLVLAGTKFFPDLEGKILFIEEEENTNVSMTHRFFTHLSQVFDLKKLRGICIGRFATKTGFTKKDPEESIYEEVFGDLQIPIIYNLNFGHTDPLFTIPIGAKAFIDTEKNIIKIFNRD
jgi:muramoyltetrapeptide carboxypeptidase